MSMKFEIVGNKYNNKKLKKIKIQLFYKI